MYTLQERWQTRLQSLRRWIEMHGGHLPESGDTLPCGFQIGKWLYQQRGKLQRQRLEAVRIGELDSVAPGWRSSVALSSENLHKRPSATEIELENRFTEHLREAAASVAEFGRFPRVDGMCAAKDRVASWLKNQRTNVSVGKLSNDRAQRLDNILPGWRTDATDDLEQQWQNALASLVARVKELGRLPTANCPSANWIRWQRRVSKQGKLNEDRERALNEAVPGWNKRTSRRESKERTDECESTSPAVRKQAGK